MATSALTSFSLSSLCKGGRRRRLPPLICGARPVSREEGIVIIGAGIGGLATALSLSRLGVRSVVLEQGNSLRTGGTSLTLFKNAWHVLDALGVGDELRDQFVNLQGMVIRSADGRELRSFSIKDEDPEQEVRAVERRVLLEALANQLAPGTVRFSSGLRSVQRDGNGKFLLDLDDGSQLLARILIGSDGVRSPVAKWMGFSEPRYVGYCAFRGLAIYPEGQPFEAKVNYVYGQGLRAACAPVSATKVFWFICFNSKSPGPKTNDPSILKKEAREFVRNWRSDILDVIDRTPDNSIVKSALMDRWLWPILTPSASSGCSVVIGDAWHPMTPNLGQGACCALEDSVILATKLGGVIDLEKAYIDRSLNDFSKERWKRIFPMTVRANLVGFLLQSDNPLICAFRDGILFPKLASLGSILDHTNFEWEFPETTPST